MFNDTITLFNRYHSNTTGDTWYPHVLHNVYVEKDKANIIATYGQESTDNARVFIHYKYKDFDKYSLTTDTTYDDSKDYYELDNGTYVITEDTSFLPNKAYYEKSVVNLMSIENLPFMPPKEWSHQTNDKLGKSITFNDDASNFDFFVMGDVGVTQPVLDDTYKKGFYNEMNNKYDYCYAITSVGAYKVIPHFELLAK